MKKAWPATLQYGGAAVTAGGLYGLVGLLWMLVIVGVSAVAVGTLVELKGGA